MFWILLGAFALIVYIVMVILDNRFFFNRFLFDNKLSSAPSIGSFITTFLLVFILFSSAYRNYYADCQQPIVAYHRLVETIDAIGDNYISVDLYNHFEKEIDKVNTSIKKEREAAKSKHYDFFHIVKHREDIAELDLIVWKSNVDF